MNINIKSQAIVISVDKSNHQILVENNLLQGVERFKLYLGSVSSASSKVNEKIKERTRAANCLYWGIKKIPRQERNLKEDNVGWK